MTRAANLAEAAGSGFAFRNRIINGDMRIDQRNAGASVTPSVGYNTYTLDRWNANYSVASKYSVQQTTTAPVGFINSLKATATSSYTVGVNEGFWLSQAIEGLNCSDLAWGTANAKAVTLSFWVYSSLTGTFGGSFTNGAQNRSYPFSYTISAANTWEQKTVTVAGDTSGTWLTTNGIGIQLFFGLGVGSTYSGTAGTWAGSLLISATGATSVVGTNGATFQISGVQLEKGTSASPFEFRMNELQLCQRYYEKSYAQGTAVPSSTAVGFFSISGTTDASNVKAPIRFAVTKRASPTMNGYTYDTMTSGSWTYAKNGTVGPIAISFDTIGDSTCRATINAGVAWAAVTMEGHWTASAEL